MARLSRVAPEIPVSDLSAAIHYYSEKLGFDLAQALPDAGYAIVERDGVALHLFTPGAEGSSPVGVHIFTDELEDLHAELRSREAGIYQDVTRKPWGNRDFRVRDCAGNELKFTEPVAEEP